MSSPVIVVRKAMLERLQSSSLGFQVLDHMPSDGAVVYVPYLAFERCGIASKQAINKTPGGGGRHYQTGVDYTMQLVTSPSDQEASSRDLDGLVDQIDAALEDFLDLSDEGLAVFDQQAQQHAVSLIDEGEGELKVARLVWRVEVR